MNTVFFTPPMVGSYHKEDTGDGLPLRKCLVLAFDDHSVNYLIADWEDGEQHWLAVGELHIDCDKTFELHGGEDEDKRSEPEGEPCPVCKRPMPD